MIVKPKDYRTAQIGFENILTELASDTLSDVTNKSFILSRELFLLCYARFHGNARCYKIQKRDRNYTVKCNENNELVKTRATNLYEYFF